MRKTILLISLFWVFSLYLRCAFADHLEELVLFLSESNFSATITKETAIFVNFYTPWCGYCQQLEPILFKVAKELNANNIAVKIGFVDGSGENTDELFERENIDGYPTLILYKEGLRFGEYTGERTESDILEYLKAKSSPIIQSISSQLELIPYLTFLENSDLFETGFLSLTVGFFIPTEDDKNNITKIIDRKNFQLLKNVALRYDLSSFFYSSSAEVLNAYNVEEDGLYVFTGDKNDVYHKISWEETSTESSIMDKILLASLPLSIPFTLDAHAIINTIPIYNHALAFYDISGSDDTFLDMLMLLAPKFKGRIMIVEVSSDEYPILHYFNVRQSDLPQLIMVDLTNDKDLKRFHFVDYLHQLYQQSPELAGKVSYDTASTYFDTRSTVMKRVTSEEVDEQLLAYDITLLESFFESYLNQSLNRSLISEEISVAKTLNDQIKLQHKQEEIPIENIVGSQINDKLFEESFGKDVLLYFHAPWCIHCKTTESTITELALLYQKDGHLQIYRIDGSKNEISLEYIPSTSSGDPLPSIHVPIRIDGFPSFYFFSRYNRTNPIEYGQDRNVESFHEFIREKRIAARNQYAMGYVRSETDTTIHTTESNYIFEENDAEVNSNRIIELTNNLEQDSTLNVSSDVPRYDGNPREAEIMVKVEEDEREERKEKQDQEL